MNLEIIRRPFNRYFLRHNPYLFALFLLLLSLIINYFLQPNLFELRVLNGNMRIFLPLMILAAGQSIVVLGGGIDLSVGTIVSLVNAVLITNLARESGPAEILWAIALGLGIGLLAGAFNGLCVAYLRLQPIVTTYATSFIYSGLALYILPRPGGAIPAELARLYRSTPASIPFTLLMVVLLLVIWKVMRATRFGTFLYALGGDAEASFTTGIVVPRMRLLIYAVSGGFAALSAVALTLSTSTGDPRIGESMTLDSIVAVVLGGTRLSGGYGGIAGSIIGVAILGTIRNIISFANVPTWWQTLVDAVIIVSALAGPGLIKLLRRRA